MYDDKRYKEMFYNYCGDSGLKLPAISLGLWQNFGTNSDTANRYELIAAAFDAGITHFDLANNYGPAAGSAELNFGSLINHEFASYRDEMVISTKAGYTMWDGPYGDWGSKKYLTASLDQSLKRLGLDYVDIFYHHRPDPNTPLEEVVHALDLFVRQGKALYVGVSNYNAEQTLEIYKLFKEAGTPFIVHQPRYNMLDRWIEEGERSLCDIMADKGIGCVAFSPLAQGVLTGKYREGVPNDSRKAASSTIGDKVYNGTNLYKVSRLEEIARQRGQSMAQFALSWALNNPVVTSVLIGARTPAQIIENVDALNNLEFNAEEIAQINGILAGTTK